MSNADSARHVLTTDDDKLTTLTQTQNVNATHCIPMLVEYCANRTAELAFPSQIRRELSCVLYGEVQGKSGIPIKYIDEGSHKKITRLAKAMLRRRVLMNAEDEMVESLTYWKRMLSNEDVPWAVKARARENLDRIMRLSPEQNTTVNVNTQNNTTTVVKLEDLGLDLTEKKEALDALRARKQTVGEASTKATSVLNNPW